MKPFIGRATALALGALASVGLSGAEAADKPYDGVTLNLASQNDQFAAVLAAIAPQVRGADRRQGQGRHPQLPRAADQDHRRFRRPHQGLRPRDRWTSSGRGNSPRPATPSISPTGSSATPPRSKSTTSIPSLMASLGGYKGKQVAFPFAGYANVLAYRKDLYEAAGLKPPATMEELVADASS